MVYLIVNTVFFFYIMGKYWDGLARKNYLKVNLAIILKKTQCPYTKSWSPRPPKKIVYGKFYITNKKRKKGKNTWSCNSPQISLASNTFLGF